MEFLAGSAKSVSGPRYLDHPVVLAQINWQEAELELAQLGPEPILLRDDGVTDGSLMHCIIKLVPPNDF